MKLKHLVATNFSPKSEMALEYALKQSQITPSEIYLFHVFEDATKNFRRLDKLNAEYMERMKLSVMGAINRLAEQGIQSKVEDVHRRIAHGKAAVEILKMAEGVNADVVIMGAPTTNAFKKLINKVPCTMVLLKDKSHVDI